MPPTLKPARAQLALEVARVGPQALDALRLLLQDVECRDARGGDRRRMRRGEQERARAVIEVIDQVLRPADVAAQRADGLRQRAHLHVDAAVHVEVVDRPAAVAAQHARGVGVVDHHDGAVLLGQGGELVHRADVAVHREHAVGDDQLVAGLVLRSPAAVPRSGDVLVAKDLDLGAREPRAVDDAGVVQLVGEDEVVLAQDRAHGAGVGRESALEDHAGFDVLEARDLLFEFHVDAHGAGDGAHCARAHAQFARGLQGRLDQLGVVAQAEVVVAGQVDDLACRRNGRPGAC